MNFPACKYKYQNVAQEHSMHHMKFSIIEQVKSMDPLYGREREKLMIRNFHSYYGGVNKEP